MSEKVVLTKEQAEEIEKYKKLVDGVYDFIHDLGGSHLTTSTDPDEEQEEMEKIMYAFVTGDYEVQPEFSVGDWVVYVHDSSVWKVTKVVNDGVEMFANLEDEENFMNGVHVDNLEHAKPEDIARYKEWRFWNKHGREVWELRKGDVLQWIDNPHEITSLTFVNDNHVKSADINTTIDFIKTKLKVVCFAEDRLEGDFSE